MSFQVSCLLLVAVFGCAWAGYNGGYTGYDQGGHNAAYSQGYTQPKVAIINHKQALSSDGTFNYAFNAENGIQQGESIGPDGSRHGGYSYVDPSGKTVSLKYVAGRDGFRVVEGDHLPRNVPLPAQHVAAYQAAAQAQADAGHAHNAASSGAAYHSTPHHSANYQQVYNNADDGSYKPSSDEGQYQQSGAYSDAAEQIHSGPHSFGSGYGFEFGGSKY